MRDRCFVDTNILVYAHTDLDKKKQAVAQEIVRNNDTVISTQVLGELANVFRKKFKKEWTQIMQVLEEQGLNNHIQALDENAYRLACNIADRYELSFYDSLIISAGFIAGCSILYSEDLQNNMKIVLPDGNPGTKGRLHLTIKNPFK